MSNVLAWILDNMSISPTQLSRPLSPFGSPYKIRKTHHSSLNDFESDSHFEQVNLPIPKLPQPQPDASRTRHSSPIYHALPPLQRTTSNMPMSIDSALLTKPHATFTPTLHRQASLTTGKLKRKSHRYTASVGGSRPEETPCSHDFAATRLDLDMSSLKNPVDDISESSTNSSVRPKERERAKEVFGLVGGRGSLFHELKPNSGPGEVREDRPTIKRRSKRSHSKLSSSSGEKGGSGVQKQIPILSGRGLGIRLHDVDSGNESDLPSTPTPFSLAFPHSNSKLPHPSNSLSEQPTPLFSNVKVSPRSKQAVRKIRKSSPIHKSDHAAQYRARTTTAPPKSRSTPGIINFTGYNLRSRQITVDDDVSKKRMSRRMASEPGNGAGLFGVGYGDADTSISPGMTLPRTYRSSSIAPPPIFQMDTSHLPSAKRSEEDLRAPKKRSYTASHLATESQRKISTSSLDEDEVDDVFGGRPIQRSSMDIDRPDLTDGTTASSSASTEDERKQFVGSVSSFETLVSRDDDDEELKHGDEEMFAKEQIDVERIQRTPRNAEEATAASFRNNGFLSTGLVNKKYRARRTTHTFIPFNLYESSIVREALGVDKEEIKHIVEQAENDFALAEKKAPGTPVKKSNFLRFRDEMKKGRASWGGFLHSSNLSPGSDSSGSPGPESPTIELLKGMAQHKAMGDEGNDKKNRLLAPKQRRVFRRHSSGPFNVGSILDSPSGSSRGGSPAPRGHRLLFRAPAAPATPTVTTFEIPVIQETPTGKLQVFASAPSPPVHHQPSTTPNGSHAHIHCAHESRHSYPSNDDQLALPTLQARFAGSVLDALKADKLSAKNKFENDFIIRRNLGRGEFSEAFEAENVHTGQLCAIKRIDRILTGPKARLRLLEEAALLQEASATSHPNILQFQDAWEQDNQLFIQTEVCRCGTLDFFLEEYGRRYPHLDELRVWKIAGEILEGLKYLHNLHILHLDIKPGNIFVSELGTLKIGDFGLAVKMTEKKFKNRRKTTGGSSWLVGDIEREGDREYLAPEILSGRYGPEADLFSLGIMLLEAATNIVLPQNGTSWQKLRRADLSEVDFHFMSPQLYEFLTQLLSYIPELRTSSVELCRHPIIARLSELRGKKEIRGAILKEPDNVFEGLLKLIPMERTGLLLEKWNESLERDCEDEDGAEMEVDF